MNKVSLRSLGFVVVTVGLIAATAPAPAPADRAAATTAANLQTAAPAVTPPAANPDPREWIDPDTGHRVIRISDEPNSQSVYFHYNSYTPEGDKMVCSSPSGIYSVDLKTLGQGTPKIEWIVDGRGASTGRGDRGTGGASVLLMAAFKSRDAYYTANGNNLYAVNVDTKVSRLVASGVRTFGR